MVTRSELNEKMHQEVQTMLQQDLDAFKIMVDEINGEEEILNMEKELMVEHDNFQAVLKQTSYELVDEIVYDGEVYKKSTIADNIAYFLNKQEVEWSYTLGMYQLIQIWRSSDLDTISYDAYDSTLRILNQTKFKGYSEWKDILATNQFLSSCHLDYIRDTSYLIYISQKHNILLDRLKMITPMDTATEA